MRIDIDLFQRWIVVNSYIAGTFRAGLILMSMPRFYFHIRDGEVHEIDPQGVEFDSLEHAVVDARKAAREMLAEKLLADEHIDGQRFEIADETGEVVETVTFKSVLRLN